MNAAGTGRAQVDVTELNGSFPDAGAVLIRLSFLSDWQFHCPSIAGVLAVVYLICGNRASRKGNFTRKRSSKKL